MKGTASSIVLGLVIIVIGALLVSNYNQPLEKPISKRIPTARVIEADISSQCETFKCDSICDAPKTDCDSVGATYVNKPPPEGSLETCNEVKNGGYPGSPSCATKTASAKSYEGSCYKDEAAGETYCNQENVKTPDGCYCDALCVNQNPPDCCTGPQGYLSVCKGALPTETSEQIQLQPPIALQCQDIADDALHLTWVGFSENYRLEWCKEGLGFDKVATSTNPKDCLYTNQNTQDAWAIGLQPDTTYNFRVRTEAQGFKASEWSDIASCKTKPPARPDLSIEKVTLANGEVITDKTKILQGSIVKVYVKLSGADIGENSPYKQYKVELQHKKGVSTAGKVKAGLFFGSVVFAGGAISVISFGAGAPLVSVAIANLVLSGSGGIITTFILDASKDVEIVNSVIVTSHQRDTVKVVDLKANLEPGKRSINIAINPTKEIKDKTYEIIPETTYGNNIWRENFDKFEIK